MQVSPESGEDAEDVSVATGSGRDEAGRFPAASDLWRSSRKKTSRVQLVASPAERRFEMLHLFYRSSSVNEMPGEQRIREANNRNTPPPPPLWAGTRGEGCEKRVGVAEPLRWPADDETPSCRRVQTRSRMRESEAGVSWSGWFVCVEGGDGGAGGGAGAPPPLSLLVALQPRSSAECRASKMRGTAED